jgi:hypothetical protein
MTTSIRRVLTGAAIAMVAAACSSSGGTTTTTTTSSSTGGAATTTGSTSSTSSTATDGGAGCSGATPATLTVKNVDVWCTVSVNGGTPSAAAVQTVCVADGMVPLSATANTGFVLGDWHHTTGDTGSGDPGTVASGTSTAKVNVTGTSACVWVCCPGTSGTPACPTTDACQ